MTKLNAFSIFSRSPVRIGCHLNPQFYFQPPIGRRLNMHFVFYEFCRGPCQHTTRGRDIVRDDVYTHKCFSESEGTRFGGPGQKTQT